MNADDFKSRIPRRQPRVVGPFPARWLGAVTVPLVVQDLSAGGCLILSSMNTLPGSRITLEIDLPDRTKVTVTAESLGTRPKGFAMRFVDLPPATKIRLERCIELLLQRTK